MIIPRSEVIDPTPNIDPLDAGNEMDSELNFVFKDQDNDLSATGSSSARSSSTTSSSSRSRRSFALAGSSVDDRPGTTDACMPHSTTTNCDAEDAAAAQRTLSVSAGFDF